ncbi:MAG: hypothetical protein N2V78_03905 [Methanophagales archaeon]|nr:hypothetical protein [Methanophagales archaeon]
MEIQKYKKETNAVTIGFKTPFTAPSFPPEFDSLLNLIRNRLIRFVNDFVAEGEIKKYVRHYHNLQRRSIRSNKTKFDGYTGIIEYSIKEIDDAGRWLLNVGFVIGCGPDSSFGCGFLQPI